MKLFSEWLLLTEVKVICNSCNTEGFASNFDWNAGKARCSKCGGSVEKLEPKTKAKPVKGIDPDVLKPSGYSRRGR